MTILIFNPHSPCGERRGRQAASLVHAQISIHTPHAGSDKYVGLVTVGMTVFQSTLPMRGATDCRHADGGWRSISIHTPHAGSDRRLTRQLDRAFLFQSTLPMRGATIVHHSGYRHLSISIHTPHAGSDLPTLSMRRSRLSNFNPHSPCGERPLV